MLYIFFLGGGGVGNGSSGPLRCYSISCHLPVEKLQLAMLGMAPLNAKLELNP